MLRRYRVLAMLLFSALLSATVSPATVSFAASGNAWPQSAQPGVRVHFDASGFTPGEPIDLWVTSPSAASEPRYPSINADSAGNAIWSWDVPANAEPGRWTMSARGRGSNQTLGIPFEVVNTVATQTITITPQRGGRGTLFQFSAGGFNANESMDTWITRPDGSGLDLQKVEDPKPTADDQGNYQWSWAAPADAFGGTYTAHVRGASTRKQYDATFVVDVPQELGPSSSVSPAEGPPGTMFTIIGDGFQGSEQIATWFNAPDGSRVDSDAWVFADGDGTITWQYTTTLRAQAGRWQAVSQGYKSRLLLTAEFIVTGDNQPASPPAAPTGTASPISGPPTTTFNYNAQGFVPGEKVGVYLRQPDGTNPNYGCYALPQPIADGTGAITWSWTAPEGAQIGDWVMAAKGTYSGLAVEIPFTITTPDDPALIPSVTPPSGAPGTTFNFTAPGFRKAGSPGGRGELVDLYAVDPNGRSYDYTGEPVYSDHEGIARWSWTAPLDAVGGAWTFIATDGNEKRRVYHEIFFTIERSGEAPAPTANASVTPSSGAPGTTFTFTGGGYISGERVSYWINQPDRDVVRFDIDAVANQDGKVVVSWTSPADAQRGLWTFVFRSNPNDNIDNYVEHVIEFRIE